VKLCLSLEEKLRDLEVGVLAIKGLSKDIRIFSAFLSTKTIKLSPKIKKENTSIY